MNYFDCEKEILDIPKFSKKNTFEDTKGFFDFLKSPGEKSKIIHVAGTNGKGSVCSFMEGILREHGYSCGLFTSPHLVTMRERIKLDGQMISEDDFCRIYAQVKDKARVYKAVYIPSFFEILFFMAMVWFEEKGPDFIILETGLGGRLDTTNVVEKKAASVITKIAMDHMEYLGNTLIDIAREKAGIIKNNIPLIYLDFDNEVSSLFEKKAKTVGARPIAVAADMEATVSNEGKCIDFSYDFKYDYVSSVRLRTPAKYQSMNASLALRTVEEVLADDFDKAKALDGLYKAYWPCRMEYVTEDILVDGAHNPDGVEALVESLSYIERDKLLLFSVVSDKDYECMIRLLCRSGQFEKIVVASVGGSRRTDLEQIVSLFKKYMPSNHGVIEAFYDAKDAYEYATLHREGRLLVIAGSLYLAGAISQIRKEGK